MVIGRLKRAALFYSKISEYYYSIPRRIPTGRRAWLIEFDGFLNFCDAPCGAQIDGRGFFDCRVWGMQFNRYLSLSVSLP